MTRPSDIAAIHRSYMEAGADIIETNTFNSTSVSLSDYGLGAYASQINLEGARSCKDGGGCLHAIKSGTDGVGCRFGWTYK